MQVELRDGDSDFGKLQAMTGALVGNAQTQSALQRVSSPFRSSVPQFDVDVDRIKTQTLHVTTDQVFSTLASYLGSSYVNQFTKFGRTFQVYTQADSRFRLNLRDIENLMVRNEQGDMVPLGTLATITPSVGPSLISLYNLYPSATVIGLPAQGYSSGQSMAGRSVTDVSVGNEVAWHQVTTFLHQQHTSLSDEPKPPPQKQPKLPAPNAILRISPGQIRRYAAVGGDHNPIHTNSVGAKLFGFPTAIAHGMFSAAAVLANLEAAIPDAVTYSVRFGKPVLLPANAGLYVNQVPDGWDLSLRNIARGIRTLTGTATRALAPATLDETQQAVGAQGRHQKNQQQPQRRPGQFPDEDRGPKRRALSDGPTRLPRRP